MQYIILNKILIEIRFADQSSLQMNILKLSITKGHQRVQKLRLVSWPTSRPFSASIYSFMLHQVNLDLFRRHVQVFDHIDEVESAFIWENIQQLLLYLGLQVVVNVVL